MLGSRNTDSHVAGSFIISERTLSNVNWDVESF